MGLFQSPVDGFGNACQAVVYADCLQMASGMEVQAVKSQLLASLHLIQKRSPRLLQPFLFRMSQIDKIAVVRQYRAGGITQLFAPFLEQFYAFLAQRGGLPLPLVLCKQSKGLCSYRMSVQWRILHSSGGRDMRSYFLVAYFIPHILLGIYSLFHHSLDDAISIHNAQFSRLAQVGNPLIGVPL